MAELQWVADGEVADHLADPDAKARLAGEVAAALAGANLEQARAADRAERILIATRRLPARDAAPPRRFAVVPADYAAALLAGCQDTA